MTSPDERRLAIASRLKAAREQAGLTQAQIAKTLGLHRPRSRRSRPDGGASPRRSSSSSQKPTESALPGSPRRRGADPARARLELAARELSKLKKEDLDRLLQLLTSLRSGEERTG